MRRITVLLFVFSAVAGFASDIKYEWDAQRERIRLTESDMKESEIILKNHVQYDYRIEGEKFVMYVTFHRIVFVNNTEAIQRNNRIYISMSQDDQVVTVKARSIDKNGKVVLFDQNNLKEVKDEQAGRGYKIFAMEGVELGSEIEYYYTRRTYGRMYERSVFQTNRLMRNISFSLSCPDHLEFDFKSYNGFPAINKEQKEDLNIYRASLSELTPIKEEQFGYDNPHRSRLEFKVAYNNARSKARLNTWDEAAKRFYTIISERDKDDDKALDKYLKTLGDNASMPLEKRIRNIEDKIKNTVQINQESSADELDKVSSIVQSKVASKQGLTKLFFAVFQRLGIKAHITMTCSREDFRFDPEFDTWGYLDEYFFYFPDVDKFFAPTDIALRFPLIPASYTAQQGLVIEPFNIGEVKSALAEIREIPAADYTLSKDDMDINVQFNSEMTGNVIVMKRMMSGYNGQYIVPYYDLMTDEQKVNMVNELTKGIAPDAKVTKWDVKIPKEKQTLEFLLSTDFTTEHFVERAGPRILLKVGDLIGPQTEMYREDKRVLPIENDYNRGYDRIIRIQIPQGYVVKNPDDLKLKVFYDKDDNSPYLFDSDYTMENNMLTVKIREYYKAISAPMERYEDFRRVINAAADFNKITLVLEKKK